MPAESASRANGKTSPIVVTTDFSDSSRAAFAAAGAFARATSKPLDVVHVARRKPPGLAPWADLVRHEVPERFFQDVQSKLDALVQNEPAFSGLGASATCKLGVPVDELAQHVRNVDAHLLVMASHGHSPIREFFLGSLPEKLVRLAPCPVLTVDVPSESLRVPPRRILVAHSFTGDGFAAFRWAADYAKLFRASLRVVSVVPGDLLLYNDPGAKHAFHLGLAELKNSLQRQLNKLADDWSGTPFSSVVRQGNTAAEILADAATWKPDIIVVGRQDLRAQTDFRLGSVAERILRRAPTAVLCASGPHEQGGS